MAVPIRHFMIVIIRLHTLSLERVGARTRIRDGAWMWFRFSHTLTVKNRGDLIIFEEAKILK